MRLCDCKSAVKRYRDYNHLRVPESDVDLARSCMIKIQSLQDS